MTFNPLSSDLAAVWDAIALAISFLAVMAVVQINGVIQKKKILSTTVTRKLVHAFVGPVFLVTWLLFSGEWFSRFFVAVVPLLFVILFYAIGSGKMKNEAFVASMSRSGEASELLRGTLYYAIIMVLLALVWFYVPFEGGNDLVPTALIVIGCLAGGDGMADIIGRKYGKHKYRFSGAEKSLEGSLGMFVGSVVFSLALVAIYGMAVEGWEFSTFIAPVLLFGAVVTVIEAVSPKNMDNWTITFGAIFMMAIANAVDPGFWPFSLIGGV